MWCVDGVGVKADCLTRDLARTGNRTHRTNLLEKNGPTTHDAVNPQHTVTFGECIGTDAVANGFSFAHILEFCVLTKPRG